MPNSLTRNAGLRLGPVVLETLVKHYFDRIKKEDAQRSKFATQLHQDELLYHEAFNIVRGFLEVSTYHTVEEIQAFSNNKTPSPPWVHVVRTLVPVSCCDQAAIHITKVLGGEELAKRIVGGTKWWQVRGVQGVDAEWITARKDYLEEKKRCKAKHRKGSNVDTAAGSYVQTSDELPGSSASNDDAYKEEMNEMRCILYAHGGGYYFGSVDQERYSIQRHARKIQGRVFAINYRLAPQYPFPCALQDILAAYLYLIYPPSDASHRPVKPEHIVVAGDSAGGGLTIALLQVLRDTGLPLPAGGILISPWCDLTHSFPSIHTNTLTDVIPQYGLSFHKPSPLWPPPPDDMTRKVHLKLRERIRQMVRFGSKEEHSMEASSNVSIHQNSNGGSSISLSGDDGKSALTEMPVDVGTTTPPPSGGSNEDQTIRLQGTSGDLLVVKEQVHLYTQNSLVGHPLISPAFSYLGGLPPLFFIASDKEVLRDEIIYTAHKAANPSRFPVKEEVRSLYPPLIGIEERYSPTAVHLQVYDDTAHVLPVLFSFTTPGKYCYRAIASFTKHVTGMSPSSRTSTGQTTSPSSTSPSQTVGSSLSRLSRALSTPEFLKGKTGGPSNDSDDPLPFSTSFHSPFSRSGIPIRAKSLRVPVSDPGPTLSESTSQSQTSDDINVADAGVTLSMSHSTRKARFAGEYIVYCDSENVPSWKEGMIRERVSTRGAIRPLEPESKLEAFAFPEEILGAISERAVQRYLDGKATFDKKYAKDIRDIEKQRERNLELSYKDGMKHIAQLRGSMSSQNKDGKGKARDTTKDIKEGLEGASASWAWALDADERPPPSSIVSRRDTTEARRLARIADQAVLQEHGQISANSLWAVVVNFLTDREHKHNVSATSDRKHQPQLPLKKRRSLFTSPRPRE